jgi:alpha-glucosidase
MKPSVGVLTGVAFCLVADLTGSRPEQRGGPLAVSSPDGALTVTIDPGNALTYRVSDSNAELIARSKISMTLQGGEVLGVGPVVLKSATRSVNQVLRPVVRIKREQIVDRYNELRIDFRGHYSVLVRAYDDGVAYRWVLQRPGEVTVESEEATFEISGDPLLYFPEDKGLLTHQERPYRKVRLPDLGTGVMAYPPVLAAPAGAPMMAITRGRSPRLSGYEPDSQRQRGACRAVPAGATGTSGP